jgi:hypothetical protein
MENNKIIDIISLESNRFDFFECAVIIEDLKSNSIIFSFNETKEFYPASLSKLFIAAEIGRKYQDGELDIDNNISIIKKNVVDFDQELYPFDQRKLLNSEEEVSIRYLLDLMLYRSDNTAANQLIDLTGREQINKNIISQNNWGLAKITRKYLKRDSEEPKYREAPVLKSNAKIFSDFWSKLWSKKLLSGESRNLLLTSLSRREETLGNLKIKESLVFYKGGYFKSINHKKQHVVWDHFSGVIEKKDGKIFSVVILTLVKNSSFIKTSLIEQILQEL